MAAARRKGRAFLPQSLLGSSPNSEKLFPVESCGRPEPHGTCSSGREPCGRSSAGIERSFPYCPAPCSSWRQSVASPRRATVQDGPAAGGGKLGAVLQGLKPAVELAAQPARCVFCRVYSDLLREEWERAAKLWSVAFYLWGKQQFWSSFFMGIILLEWKTVKQWKMYIWLQWKPIGE